jgi:hypothetical protein
VGAETPGTDGQPLQTLESAGELSFGESPQAPPSQMDGEALKAIADFAEGRTNTPPDLSKTQDPVLQRLRGPQPTEVAPPAQEATSEPMPEPAPGPQPPTDPVIGQLLQQQQQMQAQMMEVLRQREAPAPAQPAAPSPEQRGQVMQQLGLDPTKPGDHVTFDLLQQRVQFDQTARATADRIAQLEWRLAQQANQAQLAQQDAMAHQQAEARVAAEFKGVKVPPTTLANIKEQAAALVEAGYGVTESVNAALEGYRPLLQEVAKQSQPAARPAPAQPGVTHPGLAQVGQAPHLQGLDAAQQAQYFQAMLAAATGGGGAGRHSAPPSIDQIEGHLFS